MAKEQVGFKTSAFGFRKADVLACIDRMSAESIMAQEQAVAQIKALDETVAEIRQEKNVLVEQTKEAENEVLLLRDALATQSELAANATEQVEALTQSLKSAEASAREYKSKLFTREGEAIALRRDNARLTQTLSEKQTELEQASVAVETTKQEAQVQLEEVRSSATKEVQKEVQRVQLQSVAMQDTMKKSAADMAEDVVLLKQALTDLDQKIMDSMLALQQSTEALSQSLAATEENFQSLGVKLEQFPQCSSSAKTVQYVARCVEEAPVKQVVRYKQKPKTISSLLLTQISKMMGES